MTSILIAILSGVGFIVAYHTYGRFLARKIFRVDPQAIVPSRELEDGIDYVPTRKEVLFGHHFTSIAGTGPIVGPAIAIFWGWLPALLWVLLGSIFIGAVHDFGALVVSLRSRGQSIGDIAGRMISPRARVLFLIVLFFVLMVVIAIFGLVIAVIFSNYPQSVLSVWVAMPVAVGVGFWIYRRGGHLLAPSLLALVILYAAVAAGVYLLPIDLSKLLGAPLFAGSDAGFFSGLNSVVVIWTALLLVYCFFASVLPVWMLLQPRDYINSHQLVVALILLVLGLGVAHPDMVAPAINGDVPADAPPMFPFLFITVACGAISGFHCLVSSGTSSKQLRNEADAQFVGYGSMLMEGALAVIVILACGAGLGLGVVEKGETLTGAAAWSAYYGGGWGAMSGLARNVGAFIEGGGNLIAATGIPLPLAIGITAVMIACFAATTLDTATRLQRYIVQELADVVHIPALRNKYAATTVAVVTGGALAMLPGPNGPGSGGLILWPLFGAINQLLAGLAFLVVAFYLIRHSRPAYVLAIPLAVMVLLPAWAMGINVINWAAKANWLLAAIGGAVLLLEAWMILEAALMWKRARGVLPEALPPLKPASASVANEGGRAC
ncbi:MAG: carbon starvation protein A [Candidatus Hydrogenedentes bacterium]|jgi:carbon starvation protein|nr:carbon starvation protein A [Candidatus Hydrogenedentota bacterium]HQM32728.1 carbon starvation protein A [Candidatus Hydrogenedentota bacterium]